MYYIEINRVLAISRCVQNLKYILFCVSSITPNLVPIYAVDTSLTYVKKFYPIIFFLSCSGRNYLLNFFLVFSLTLKTMPSFFELKINGG